MENKFGKVSRITVRAACRDGKTILEDLSFTAPYKVMKPFYRENEVMQVMPLCASAGIMRGDVQEFSYHVCEGAKLEMLSQSFEKIHRMEGGSASRKVTAKVEKNAVLYYYPQPVIPFADSAFDSRMEITLEDTSSLLFLMEIISCGRVAHDERFAYRRFSSRVEIRREDRLIYRDNTRYEPEKMPMEGIGMYEGYTHMANIFMALPKGTDSISMQDEVVDLLEKEGCDGGVTRLSGGDLAVRIFGLRAQKLQDAAEKIKKIYEENVYSSNSN